MTRDVWKVIGFAALAFGLYRLWQGYKGAEANAVATHTAHSWQYPLLITLSASKDLYLGAGAVVAVALWKAYK